MDLNLLLVLDALLEENSVQGAAERLGLSPPAVSRSLGRLRRTTGDDLLVRTGRTMTPTPHALRLRDEAHDLVQRARLVLAPTTDLDLDTLERVFTIRGHDALTTAIGPPLTELIRDLAPHAALRTLNEPSTDDNELQHGRVDLDLGASAASLPELVAEQLGTDHLVVACRASHPLTKGTLTSVRFAATTQVVVSRRGRLHDAIDDMLATQGLQRRVVAAFPTTAAALDHVARTDCLVMVGEQVCRTTMSRMGFQSLLPPFQTPLIPVIMTWHRRYQTDPAHLWLRTQVRQLLHVVLESPTQPSGPRGPATTVAMASPNSKASKGSAGPEILPEAF